MGERTLGDTEKQGASARDALTESNKIEQEAAQIDDGEIRTDFAC
jgi:hypothetical protein